jgi:hypothetical protein
VVRRTLWLAALSGALLAATGCQDLLGLTSGKSGGTGGTGGSTTGPGGVGGSTTGGSTTGGSGGNLDCPPECTSNDCRKATCVDGVCQLVFVPPGKVVQDAFPGDCKADVCDGNGTLLLGAPTDDDIDDGNDCTWDACADGVSGHPTKRDGTRCSNGLCEGGACLPSACNGVPGQKDGTETDVDCGGGCAPCALAQSCQINADCASDFCASGQCAEPLALGLTLTTVADDTYIGIGTFDPAANAWTTTLGPSYGGLGTVGATFDAAGEGLGVVRQAATAAIAGGARVAHWTTATGWSAVDLWAMGGAAGNSSSTWFPSFAVTDDGLSLFAQNTNQQHLRVSPTLAGGAFTPVLGTTGTFSGVGIGRQGHASFFFANGTSGLAETRYIGGAWSAPKTVLEGNYADAQPAALALPTGGTLVVALSRQDNGDHLFDWVVLPDKGAPAKGTLPGLTLAAPDPPARRFALAARAGGGVILAYRKADNGALDAWLADVDAVGIQNWKQGSGGPIGAVINGDPAMARGLPGTEVELLCVMNGGSVVRHYRLDANGQWPFLDNVVAGVPANNATVAIATP